MGSIRSSGYEFDELGWEMLKKDVERLSLKAYQIIYQGSAFPQGNAVPSDFTRQTLQVCIDGDLFNQDFLAGPAIPII